MTRGLVLPLEQKQILQRMKYLVGEATLDSLDDFIDRDPKRVLRIAGYQADLLNPANLRCPTIYYLLKDYNGGTDPRAPDPATRWHKPGETFTNITCDCIGGMCWCGGWDRFQPVRFKHLYGGWINTDSIFMDCELPEPRCFRVLKVPRPGCFIVARTGSPGHEFCGHIGGLLDYNGVEFDYDSRDCWKRMRVANVAAYHGQANRTTTGLGWFNCGAIFVESIMVP